MKKNKLLTKPQRITDVRFDDLDEDSATDTWMIKSERLQARRWRKLRQQWV
jgi:hypothetical protein